LVAQRFSCTLRSPGSFFWYFIKAKQLQKFPNVLAEEGVHQHPRGELHEQMGVSTVALGGGAKNAKKSSFPPSVFLWRQYNLLFLAHRQLSVFCSLTV